MDDCSPDNTPEVAMSFRDARVKHIRNKQNLGHLRNYNKGIEMSRGKYVWLISADDRLRRPYVLHRYVLVMNKHPAVGYVCCPGIGVENGVETTLLDCGYYGPRDRIFNGREFITTSVRKESACLAPSVMVRKDCYEKISIFPLDMPHQGDAYLWFRWALEYDVAYLCEPMVNYRSHDLNMMKDLLSRVPETVFRDEVTVLWRTKQRGTQKGYHALVDKCESVLALKYARATTAGIYGDTYSPCMMNSAQCDQAMRTGASSVLEYRRLRGKFFAWMGNTHWRHSAFGNARWNYALALRNNWRMPQIWLKIIFLLVGLGPTGLFLMNFRLNSHSGGKTSFRKVNTASSKTDE
jgi:glycosyltransferase involved in cell wall biosynthesis